MLNWVVLMLLGASLATTFEGLIVSFLSFSQTAKNGIFFISNMQCQVFFFFFLFAD